MNYYRRYIGDYGRDTTLLSLAEHGAYALLLDHYYASEEPLPPDREDVYRVARAVKPEERKAVDRVLEKYFTEEPDGFHNSRADAELDRAKPAIDAAKRNGSRGGRPSKDNPPDDPSGNPSGNPTDNPPGYETPPKKKPSGKAIRAGDPTTNHQPPPPNRQPPDLLTTPPQEARGGARATRLPPDWGLSADAMAWTKSEGLPDAAIAVETAKFRDYWNAKAGKDATKRDWDATWRNWVRRAMESAKARTHATPATNANAMALLLGDTDARH